MRNDPLKRRIAILEAKVVPKLSQVEEMLCRSPVFQQLVASMGLNLDDMKRRGKVLGALPREFLQQLVERLRQLT